MSAWLRWALPAPWHTALGVALFMAALVFSALVGSTHGNTSAPLVTAQGWALASTGWWLLLGPRLCNLAYGMIRLRLPGIPGTLAGGVALHLLLGMGLPLLGLLAWQPSNHSFALLLGAVWLGASAGLLLVSLPLPLLVAPLLAIGLGPGVVHDPVLSAAVGAWALLLAGLAWRWQLASLHSAWMMPLGVALEGSYEHLLRLPARLRTACPPQHRLRHRRTATDHLAATLGPAFQTLRQHYGRRGQCLGYLIFIATTGLILWLQGQQTSMFVSGMAIISLVMLASQPARTLANLHARDRATLAELRLLPGLPAAAQLPGAVARQLLSSMAEKLLVVTLTMAALGTTWPQLNIAWLLGLAGFSLLLLVFALWMTLLAWHWPGKPALRIASIAVLIGAGFASSARLHLHGDLPVAWATGWVLLTIAMIVGTGMLHQRVQAAVRAA